MRVFSHNGDTLGQHTDFLAIPAQQFALIVLTNGQGGGSLAATAALDAALAQFPALTPLVGKLGLTHALLAQAGAPTVTLSADDLTGLCRPLRRPRRGLDVRPVWRRPDGHEGTAHSTGILATGDPAAAGAGRARDIPGQGHGAGERRARAVRSRCVRPGAVGFVRCAPRAASGQRLISAAARDFLYGPPQRPCGWNQQRVATIPHRLNDAGSAVVAQSGPFAQTDEDLTIPGAVVQAPLTCLSSNQQSSLIINLGNEAKPERAKHDAQRPPSATPQRWALATRR
jgi:hypothetical protein